MFSPSHRTGQRIGDVLRRKWEDTGGDGIKVKQGKTAQVLSVPFTRHLRAALKAARHRSVFVLINHHAMGPWSYRGASQTLGPIIVQSPEMVRHDTRATHYEVVRDEGQ